MCLVAGLGFSGQCVLHAQTDEEVDAARLKAIDFIRSGQKSDGHWDYPSHEVGLTALCTLGPD